MHRQAEKGAAHKVNKTIPATLQMTGVKRLKPEELGEANKKAGVKCACGIINSLT
jgi:hypothetical protein